jgi:hypothetical protein
MAEQRGMNPELWLKAAQTIQTDDSPALLLPEIAALLYGKTVWLPYKESWQINGVRWIGDGAAIHSPAVGIDAVYFGVPTIVDNKALFGQPDYTVERARLEARLVTQKAIECGAKLIVSGLGSGDISVDDRIADMGTGMVVAYKKFDTFEDWIICRWL